MRRRDTLNVVAFGAGGTHSLPCLSVVLPRQSAHLQVPRDPGGQRGSKARRVDGPGVSPVNLSEGGCRGGGGGGGIGLATRGSPFRQWLLQRRRPQEAAHGRLGVRLGAAARSKMVARLRSGGE